MVVAGVIVFVILAIIAVRMIVTAINSSSQKALAEEETKGYTMVDSTELGEDGKPLQVPVPDGFTASQVPGETTVNGGFVIYEGEVDWSKIEDLSSYAEVETQVEETEINANSENSNSVEVENANNENSENTNNENTNSDSTNTEAGEENKNIEDVNNTESNSSSNEVVESEESENNVKSAENNEIKNEEEETEEKSAEVEETEQGEAPEENVVKEERQANENEETEPIEGEQENKEQAKGKVGETEEAEIATMSEEENGEIETLAEGETPITVFDLQTSTNQYVWVPVKDVSRIYGIDSNGKLWGKLYNYANANETTPRANYNWSENSTSGVMSIGSKTSYREPDITRDSTNYDRDSRLQGYRDGIERYQMLSQEMEESFYKMIESVKKYGGFYIGRYETGDLNQKEAVVQKMNNNIDSQTWYTMYEKCKNLAGTNENIETSMIWGSLWDETLQWLVDSEAKISTGETIDYTLINNSTKWGYYYDTEFEYRTKDGGIAIKAENDDGYGDYETGKCLPTGCSEYTKVNNIYDLAGSRMDWTLEAYSSDYRVYRGGYCSNYGSYLPAGSRSDYSPTVNSSNRRLSLRTLHKVMCAYPEPLYPDTQTRTGSKV